MQYSETNKVEGSGPKLKKTETRNINCCNIANVFSVMGNWLLQGTTKESIHSYNILPSK